MSNPFIKYPLLFMMGLTLWLQAAVLAPSLFSHKGLALAEAKFEFKAHTEVLVHKLAGPYAAMVVKAAKAARPLPPALLHASFGVQLPSYLVLARLAAAVVQVESSARRHIAVSKAGAIGPMQLMPHTAWKVLSVNPWKPEQNIKGGTRYLAKLLRRYKSVPKALAAYNAGPTRIAKPGPLPLETRHYVKKVMRLADLEQIADAQ